eukprot:TRINITY_DN68969_c0_g1_i1.p1 TRINITY_DN68969_c0_g1~~TRINITY_DN68969_c0_g1_i1.p1  ORF type:complete len:241 (+),score=15.10 TRINITY_DN68969_c0_g1_i1:24-725(+)
MPMLRPVNPSWAKLPKEKLWPKAQAEQLQTACLGFVFFGFCVTNMCETPSFLWWCHFLLVCCPSLPASLKNFMLAMKFDFLGQVIDRLSMLQDVLAQPQSLVGTAFAAAACTATVFGTDELACKLAIGLLLPSSVVVFALVIMNPPGDKFKPLCHLPCILCMLSAGVWATLMGRTTLVLVGVVLYVCAGIARHGWKSGNCGLQPDDAYHVLLTLAEVAFFNGEVNARPFVVVE